MRGGREEVKEGGREGGRVRESERKRERERLHTHTHYITHTHTVTDNFVHQCRLQQKEGKLEREV